MDCIFNYNTDSSGGAVYGVPTVNCTFNQEIIDPKIVASNVKVIYAAGSYYIIKVYGTDGKLVNGATVNITGKISKTLTTTDGISKLK